MTKLVIMIDYVANDLKSFIKLYIVFLLLFSVIFSLLGFNRYHIHPQEGTDPYIPGYEYSTLKFAPIANFLLVTRYSLGDFDFEYVESSSEEDTFIFWITWYLIIMMTGVILLNFIVAEVTNSYQTVHKHVQEL